MLAVLVSVWDRVGEENSVIIMLKLIIKGQCVVTLTVEIQRLPDAI